MKRRTHTRVMNNRVHRKERGPVSWSYVLITLFCTAIIAAGFFFAALQHFATIDLSFKNSKLRKQVDELNAEKRRLLLSREVALSPAEITKTAKSLGFREVDRDVEALNETVAANSKKPSDRELNDVKTEKVVDSRPSPASVNTQNKDKQTASNESAKMTKTVLTAPVRDRSVSLTTKNTTAKQGNSSLGGESRARRVNEPITKNEKANSSRSTKLR